MDPTQSHLDLAAVIIKAQSRLHLAPNSTQMKLKNLEILLTTARDQMACGDLLTRTDIHHLNKAFDELAAR
ncbi:hypothetical protein [Sphingobium mellinum]|uniref:hypothetical protein n=1 Tax=Sphingobium mellinum TaxID=1387166 RepID=UPI0030EF7590